MVVDSILYVHLPAQKRCSIKPYLSNLGNLLPITAVRLKLICEDTWVKSISGETFNFPTMQPGASVLSNSVCGITYDSTFPNYFNLKFEMSSNGWLYWKDSIRVNVITGIEEDLQKPLTFKLEQNYPNPFNPSTRIQYQVSSNSHVSLNVYDVLGNEIATLVNEEKEPGSFEVEFNLASGNRNLASGVYFYQLKAGEFIETKKMILLR